ncbi:HepT-like ribonuclease domain-containing protein [Pseudobutyrivibrio sp.]
MQHRDYITIKKIIKEIEVGTELVGEATEEEFLVNEMMKRAVAMTVINVGELIKVITPEMRQAHKEVPWKQAAGLRDITAHRYQTLRMEDVYSTLKIDFPWIKEMLKKILDEETEE